MNNTVTVGPVEALDVTALTAIKPRWCGTAPAGPGTYTAQLRAHGGETEVTAELVDGTLHVTFTEPVRGVAPGQAIVLYDGTRVVGSATIATTVARATAAAVGLTQGPGRVAPRRRPGPVAAPTTPGCAHVPAKKSARTGAIACGASSWVWPVSVRCRARGTPPRGRASPRAVAVGTEAAARPPACAP